MSSTFRASPWVTYQPMADASQVHPPPPPPNPSGTTMVMDMDMDVDVDMDAPHISTLRDEDSPPPPAKKARTGPKPKAPKLKVTEPSGYREKKITAPSDGEDLDEDEEDQLIDDDEETGGIPASSLPRSADPTPKKKPAAKAKKPKKEGGEGGRRPKSGSHTLPTTGAPHLAPTMSWFPASPSKAHKEGSGPSTSGATADGRNITVEGGSGPSEPIILKLSAPGKAKKPSPRKNAGGTSASAGAPRKGKGAKQKGAIPLLAMDDVMSEAGFSGTAASTPATATVDLPDMHDVGTPDTETPIAPSSPPAIVTAQLAPEETPSLEGVPIPQYPLPTKPFPVQPPVKITSGFAPPIPLDRSGKKVRHWKVANREIRGIAGGRWFTKTWVGEKESELADSAGPVGPKIDDKSFIGHHVTGLGARMTVSAPTGRGRGRGSKSASVVGSAVPSRSGSVVPDVGPSMSTIKLPTKMRILQLPPSETGDSDVTSNPQPEPVQQPEPPAEAGQVDA